MRSSSTLPLPMPVHPLPTKTRGYLHLNPTPPRTTLSSSQHSSSCYRPNSINSGPSTRPPPPPPPLHHSTPPVLLRPAFPTICFQGPKMRPPTPPLPLPGPHLWASATLHLRFIQMVTRFSVTPHAAADDNIMAHSDLALTIPRVSRIPFPSRLRVVGRWCCIVSRMNRKKRVHFLPPTTSHFVGSETSNRASVVSSSGSSFMSLADCKYPGAYMD